MAERSGVNLGEAEDASAETLSEFFSEATPSLCADGAQDHYALGFDVRPASPHADGAQDRYALGFDVRPASPHADGAQDIIDVAIIGAGAAGLTAGLYAARAGLSVQVFERISPGGQLAQTEQVENYPGFPGGVAGFDLAWSMKEQAEEFGVRIISDEIVSVDFSAAVKRLVCASGIERYARSVIVASGARPRALGLAREEELIGHGVSYCATCDGNFFRNKEVAVVGGGNTAAADALYLSRICKRVFLIHRRDSLRATSVYYDRLRELPNVEFIWNTRIDELLESEGHLAGLVLVPAAEGASGGADAVERARASVHGNANEGASERGNANEGASERGNANEGASATTSSLAVDGLFVAVGVSPNTEFLDGALSLDEAGYIVANETGKTSVSGVFAAGDVRTKELRQVVTAVADGAFASEQVVHYLAAR